MIYVIGGPPRVGKSTLAAMLLRKKSISCISTDVIRNFLDRSPAQTGLLQLTEVDRVEAFTPYFYEFVHTISKKYDNYAIEGDIFEPSQVAAISSNIPVRGCFLGSSSLDLEDIVDPRFGANWVSKLVEEEQNKIPASIMARSQYLKEQAERFDIPYFDIFPDRDETLKNVLEHLCN